MEDDYEDLYKERFLTQKEWEREAFRLWQWQSAESPEEAKERLETEHEMGLVAVDFLLVLSRRQQQVVQLYCLESLTQTEVAEALGNARYPVGFCYACE